MHLATSGDHVVALGRAVGGAHGNPRWSTWTGGVTGLHETLQPFETFGGPSAIGLTDLVSTPTHEVVLGSWAAGGRPAGVATWTSRGEAWVRHDVVPGLASSATQLARPAAAAVDGDDVVVAGAVTLLGGGRVTDRATVFRAAPDGTATRLPLPVPAGSDSAALAVACAGGTCVVAGQVDGRLALWRVAGGRAPVRLDVRDAAAGLDLAGASPGPAVAVAVDERSRAWVAADDGRRGVLVRLDGADVRTAAAPPGRLRDLVLADGALVALVADGDDVVLETAAVDG